MNLQPSTGNRLIVRKRKLLYSLKEETSGTEVSNKRKLLIRCNSSAYTKCAKKYLSFYHVPLVAFQLSCKHFAGTSLRVKNLSWVEVQSLTHQFRKI